MSRNDRTGSEVKSVGICKNKARKKKVLRHVQGVLKINFIRNLNFISIKMKAEHKINLT